MNTCKNCIYWRRGGHFRHENGIFGNLPSVAGEFMRVSDRGNIICVTDDYSKKGMCLHVANESDMTASWLSRENYEKHDGITSESNENRADLRVGEDFGCIHHEPKI